MSLQEQKEFLFPEGVRVLRGKVEAPERLLLKKELQTCDCDPLGTSLEGPCELLLDYGRELCGGVRILCECANKIGSQLRLVFGESVAEALSNVSDSSATNDHSPRDFTAPTTMLSDVCYGQTGFRYVRLIFPEPGYQVKLIAVAAVSVTSAREPQGYFRSEDPRLNAIYDTAVRTVQLCLQNGYVWDGIKRDRIVWLGDMNPEIKTLNCLYPSCENVENSLDFVIRHTPEGGWINNIPSYSMWWIINVRDYGFHINDRQWIRRHFPKVREILAQFSRAAQCQWDFQQVAYTEMPWYLDWPTYGSPDSKTGVFALLKLALKAAEEMALFLKEDLTEGDILRKQLPVCAYSGSYKQIMALCALAGDVPYDTAAAMIAKNGAKGFSTFQSYYMLKVMAEGGQLSAAMDCVKEYFGGMLDMGATSFWEDFDVEWCENASPITEAKSPGKPHIHQDFGKHCYVGLRHSLCHGWASGVAAFLTEYVLGVRECYEGKPQVQIPKNTGLSLSVQGQVPTCDGGITLKRDADGEVSSNFK